MIIRTLCNLNKSYDSYQGIIVIDGGVNVVFGQNKSHFITLVHITQMCNRALKGPYYAFFSKILELFWTLKKQN